MSNRKFNDFDVKNTYNFRNLLSKFNKLVIKKVQI